MQCIQKYYLFLKNNASKLKQSKKRTLSVHDFEANEQNSLFLRESLKSIYLSEFYCEKVLPDSS